MLPFPSQKLFTPADPLKRLFGNTAKGEKSRFTPCPLDYLSPVCLPHNRYGSSVGYGLSYVLLGRLSRARAHATTNRI
jgi:hypothetical protein